MATIVRGNRMMQTNPPVGDKTWTDTDRASAKTVDARWISMGVSPEEREQLLSCWIWKKKLPGLSYTDPIESRLAQLVVKS